MTDEGEAGLEGGSTFPLVAAKDEGERCKRYLLTGAECLEVVDDEAREQVGRSFPEWAS